MNTLKFNHFEFSKKLQKMFKFEIVDYIGIAKLHKGSNEI